MKKFISILLLCSLSLFFCSCNKSKTDISEYFINCEYSSGELSADMQVEFSMPSTLDEVCFNLYFNAYRKDAEYFVLEEEYLPQNASYGYGEILSVSTYEQSLDYFVERNGGLLRIKLDKKRKKGERVTLFISFLVKLSNFNHRLSVGEQTVNLGNFFPILCVWEEGEFVHCPYYAWGDPFYSEVSNFNLQLTCEGTYSVASSGECLSVKNEGELSKYIFKGENIRDFALVLSKDFNIKKERLNQTEISYYYFEEGEEEINLIKECLNFFSEKFYPYPYSTFSVAQSDFCFGGMEYPQLVLINKTLNRKQRFWTIVHEVAHQWWYGLVGNNQIKDAFFDEGLAEYSTILFFNSFPDYEISAREDIVNKKMQYIKFTDFFTGLYGKNYNFSPSRSLGEYKNSNDYINSVYIYTPYSFWQVGSSFEQKKFCENLSKFAYKFVYKTVNSQNFVNFMDEVGLNGVLEGKFPV